MSKLIGVIFLIIVGAGFFLLLPTKTEKSSAPPLTSVKIGTVEKTATFTIITDNIVRNFNASKYHNQSQDVFINADNPATVYVKKEGITWSDFFAALPMKLTKECLITGDGETLCDKKQGILKFYLNNKEDKDLLDKEIRQGDKALIQFTSY